MAEALVRNGGGGVDGTGGGRIADVSWLELLVDVVCDFLRRVTTFCPLPGLSSDVLISDVGQKN
jgi:hypothetical protein